MNTFTTIEYTKEELPFGTVRYSYKWVGSPFQPVAISKVLKPEFIDNLPWPLVRVDVDDSRPWDVDYYLRIDGFLRPWSWLVRFRYWIKRLLEPIYYRLILTAMVWGLAYTPPGTVPGWRDLGKKNPYDV